MGPRDFSASDWACESHPFVYPVGWVERVEADRRAERVVALGSMGFYWWEPAVSRRVWEVLADQRATWR
jgi:hypothetical protein